MSDGPIRIRYPHNGQVARLVPRDQLARDDEQRLRLYAIQSGGSPSVVIAQWREELAHRLALATKAVSTCDFDEVETSARRLRRIGLDLGFPTLAAAADNVLDSLIQADGAAIGATVARLQRLGVLALEDLST